MVWSVGVPNPCKFYKNTEQVQGRESFEVGVGGLGRPLWGGPNWAQCWMKVGASQAVTWVRCCPGSWEWETEGKVRGRGADTRWCLPEQPQPHSEAWLVLWGIFREAGWNHMSQNRLAFQAFHLCFVTLRHFIGFLSHRWQKERNVFERVRRRKHLETHRNSWEFKSSSLWGASGGAGEALSYVLSLTDQTLPQRLSPLNFHIVFSFFFFFCCQYQIFLFYCFCFFNINLFILIGG